MLCHRRAPMYGKYSSFEYSSFSFRLVSVQIPRRGARSTLKRKTKNTDMKNQFLSIFRKTPHSPEPNRPPSRPAHRKNIAMAATHTSKLQKVLIGIAESSIATHAERMEAIRQLAQIQKDRKERLAKRSPLLG
jgi:hypothetical protein